jgi:thioredoxin reductase (NADPH)
VVTIVEPTLSSSQLEELKGLGEIRSAPEGTKLYGIGDATYPFIVLLEGEVAILDANGQEIVTHGPGKFLGEINLLSGQTVYVTAVAQTPVTYIEISRERFRQLLYEDSTFSEMVLATFIGRRELLQTQENVGIEIVGPRSSEPTRRIVDFVRRYRLPFTWHDEDEANGAVAEPQTDEKHFPVVRLPGGRELVEPTSGEVSRALGIGAELAPREDVDLLIVGAGPAGLGAAVYGASEGLSTLMVDSTGLGGQAGTSRRIENYLGFPGGITGTELTTRAVTQARKFGARIASPYRALSLACDGRRKVVTLEGGHEVHAKAVVLATGAEYRRLPVEELAEYEGVSVFYEAGPPEARLCGASRVGVIGGGNSAAQAAVWLARGGALVTLIHRRADLSETMSDYLIHELDRYKVEVLGKREITALHGSDGELSAVTLSDGTRMNLSFVFLFLGAAPCTQWLDGAVSRDDHGFVLTGERIGAARVLETNVPGVYAVGDARAGSIKRCATAVGEGAMVVRYVHEHLTGVPA